MTKVPAVASSREELNTRIRSGIASRTDTSGQSAGSAGYQAAQEFVQSGGKLTRGTTVNTARTVGTAAGAVCGPGAPLCGPVFGLVAGEFAGAFHDWISGTRRKLRRYLRHEDEAYANRDEAVNGAIRFLQQEYIDYLDTYVPVEEVWDHLNLALDQIQNESGSDACRSFYAAYVTSHYQTDAAVCIDEVLPLAVARVQATYRNLQAAQMRWAREQYYKGQASSDISSARAGGQSMARAYGESMQRIEQLKAAGFSEADAIRIASEGESATESALAAKQQRGRNWLLIGLGLAALGGGTYYYLWHTDHGRRTGKQLKTAVI